MKEIKSIKVDIKKKNLSFEWEKILKNIEKLDNLQVIK